MAADKVLAQFKLHLSRGELDDAYIIGRRFALFSTVSLPSHHYYKSPKHARERVKNQKDTAWVTRGIERIVEVMDTEETTKELQKKKDEEERKQKQKEEEQQKQLEWETRVKKRLHAVDSFDLHSKGKASDMDEKLAKLNALFPKDGEAATVDDNVQEIQNSVENIQIDELPPPIAPPDTMNNEDLALFYSTDATQQLKSDGGTPMFPDPPSYSDLFLDSLKTSDDASVRTDVPPKIPVRQLRSQCIQQFDALLQSKQIEIIKLATYQGRLSHTPRYDSTNGCTVISPLIVATHINPHHYTTTNKQYKHGISNTEINEVIDKRAPPILTTVRSKLGLNEHALIIPSDVHDHLVDEKILPQEKFVGVCGGNILDFKHWSGVIDMMVNGRGDENAAMQKSGAAVFFRDHVISLLKIPLGNGACYFDLIDSLPSSQAGGMAIRIRCKDQSAFEGVFQWYATSKFSEAHCDFIDATEWNDGMCDFDPRVFQGFVWSE